MFSFLGGLIRNAGQVLTSVVRRVAPVLRRIAKIAAPIVG
jgi:hypothetical protein